MKRVLLWRDRFQVVYPIVVALPVSVIDH